MDKQVMDPRGSLELLHRIEDSASGLKGVIAIHTTALGPAAGGCRLWTYDGDEAMEIDAARLARGMSYKNALAGLPFGGGKAVLRRPSGAFDRQALFRAFGRAVAGLDGRYVTAEDVGTGVADMQAVRAVTGHVAGLEAAPGRAGGDPSPWTALGIFKSMQAAAQLVFGSDLKGLRVAVQGAGNVGSGLCRLLSEAGAKLIVADIDAARARALADKYGARYAFADEILEAEADILAPCALGAVLNDRTISRLNARLVCGGANNQLATDADGVVLLERGIAFVPDYVANAGGIINVAAEYMGETTAQVEQRIGRIGARVTAILGQAARERRPSHEVADEMAQRIIATARQAA